VIACPVCEHEQAAGSECEQCGRPLAEGRGTDPPVPPLEGLEATGLDATGEVPVQALDGLEPTLLAGAGAVVLEPVDGLEPTLAEPVDPAVQPLEGVERIDDAVPDDAATVAPAAVACRYCRSEARPGELICGRCGMRLPVAGPAPARRAGEGPARCGCGAPVTRSVCPACGARTGA
jgi:hypothetical protein